MSTRMEQSMREANHTHRVVGESESLMAELRRVMAERGVTPAQINALGVRRPDGSLADQTRALRETLAALRSAS